MWVSVIVIEMLTQKFYPFFIYCIGNFKQNVEVCIMKFFPEERS